MGTFMDLHIIIPTYNEAANLKDLVSALFSLSLPSGLKILVVDDNSPDGTGDIADDLTQDYQGCLSVLHRPGKLGLGSAYITGFNIALESGADSIIQMDADFSHPPEKVIDLLGTLATTDAALGSRYVPGGMVDECWPMWRKSLSAFGNIYAKNILRLPVNDATGGFRAWRRETLLGMPLDRVRSNGYAFQVEMAYIAYRLGFSFAEVPFYFADRQWGNSKMSLRIQIEAAIRVWQMLYEYRDLHAAQRSNPNSLSM
jgi:dolichol-phosphate mannosyltransferase